MTIQQHASFDSSAAELNATSKLVKAWESKNAKNAAKAGGVSLMAVSLAACGGSSDVAVDLTPFAQSDIDAAVAAVDLTTDNAAAVVTALTTEAGVTHATVDAAVAAGIASVDITSDNAALIAAAVAAVDTTTDDATAVSLALRNAAADAGVTGTSTMTNAELITAIKTANDASIAAGVDLTTDNATAIDAAVVALGISGIATLAQLNTAYDLLANPVATTTTLTTGADAVTGTANNDTLHGVVDSNTAANDTLNASDVISMGAGTDTLNITFETAAAVAMPSASISGVEVFNIKNVSGQTLALDMASISGATTLNANMSTDIVNITNIASGTTGAVTGNGVVTNGASSFGYVAAATSSTINIAGGVTAGAITVTGTGVLAETYTSTGAANTTGLITNAATTTAVTIDATTDLTATMTGTAVASLTVTGAGDVDLNGATLDATIITINASGASGDVDLIVGNVATATNPGTVDIADVNVTGGSGNDDISFAGIDAGDDINVNAGAGDDTVTIDEVVETSSATVSGDVIVGGAGTDILAVDVTSANAQTAVTTVSGFEELTVTNALVTGGITVANFQAGLNVVNLAAGGIGEITFEAGSNTVNLIAPLTAGTLALTDTGTAITDSVTIVNEDEAADAFADRTITSTGFETVNLVTTGLATAGGTNTATAQDIGVVTVTVDTGGTAVVNVSGTNIANMNGIVTAHTLNFSGLTAQAAGTATADMTGFAFEYVGATGSGTITGSAGDDVLLGDTGESTNIDGGAGADNITGGSAAETISGGAGNDIINGGGGADTINGNDGNDSITLGGGTESVDAGAGNDTVTAAGNLTFGTTIVGGAGTDILSTNAGVTAPNGSVVSGFSTLTLATAGTTDLDNFGNNTFTTVTSGALGAQVVQSVRSEVITLDGIATGTLTVTMEDATGTADTVALAVSGNADLTQTLDFVVAGVETVNLTSTDTDDTTANVHTVFLDADSATTLNVSGNTAIVIAAGSGDLLDVITMNASGLVLAAVTDAGITYVSDYTTVGGVATITGSNGVDSLTGNVNTNDTISGGAGVDTIVYVGGSDTFTGGAGNDVFDINALSTQAAHATVTDAAAGDTVDLAGLLGTPANVDYAAGATWAAQEVTLGSAATLANYLDAAAAGNGSGAAEIITWFEFSGKSYVVMDNTAGATFAATDAVVAFTGTSLLDDASVLNGVLTIA